MIRLAFGGCSFTHAPDSWAHVSNPWAHLEGKKEEIEKRTNSYTHIEFIGNVSHALEHVEEQYKYRCHAYGIKKTANFHPDIIFKGAKRLDPSQYEINILASGANSNADNVRRMIYFLENSVDKIDAIVFQITAVNRMTSLLEPNQKYKSNPKEDFQWSIYDDIVFEKQVHFHEQHTSDCAMEVESIESLQYLTMFAKANNIKLKFFHGWDNFPYPGTMNYVTRKYDMYVRPNLLTNDDIPNYASRFLKPRDVFQYQDSHPSTLSHILWWNDYIRPYCLSLR
jgi:hypothetical protein